MSTMEDRRLPIWRIWLEMIRSDQLTAAELEAFLKSHPEFARWYETQRTK